MQSRVHIISEDQLESLASEVIPYIIRQKIVLLQGSLGAGKTRFVRALGSYFGIEKEVGSPSFSIINEYKCHHNSWGINRIFHMDLYRLKNLEEALDIGIQEYLDSGEICIIEWPELAEPLYRNENPLLITIEVLENQQRKFTLTL